MRLGRQGREPQLPPEPVPAWSALPDPAAHAAFMALVRDAFEDLGATISVQEQGRTVVVTDGPTVYLDNLAALVASAPTEDAPAVVAAHLALLLRESEPVPTDPDALRAAVRVRLYSADVLDPTVHPLRLPSRPVADGLVECLVVDTPDSVQLCEIDTYAPLGLGLDELFELGRANLRADGSPALAPMEVGDARLLLAEGDSFYIATWALLLDELVRVPADGLLVSIPDRHTIVMSPIDGPATVSNLNAMIGLGLRQYESAPGNITADLYWLHEGELIVQPVRRDETGAVGFHPTPELVALLG